MAVWHLLLTLSPRFAQRFTTPTRSSIGPVTETIGRFSTARRRSRATVREHGLALAVIALTGFALPAYASTHWHAYGALRGDDWSYLRTLFHFVDGGSLNFNHWVSMTLLGQLALATPIVLIRGHAIAACQILATTLGLAGLLAAYSTSWTITQRRSRALIVAVTISAAPFWGVLAGTFMTDVPAFAMSAIAIAFGVRAVQVDSLVRGQLGLATAFGLFAFTIREYAAIPLIAILAVSIATSRARRDEDDAAFATKLSVASAIFMVFFLIAWRFIPDSKGFSPFLPDGHSLQNVFYKGAGLLRLVGLWTLPVLVIRGPQRIIRNVWRSGADTTIFIGAAFIGWLGYTGYHAPRIAFAGNYFGPNGALSRDVSSGFRPDIVPLRFFQTLIGLGSIGATLLVLTAMPPIIERLRSPRATRFAITKPTTAILCLIVIGYTAVYTSAAFTSLPLYDRYALPLGLPIALLVINVPNQMQADQMQANQMQAKRGRRRKMATGSLTLCGLLALSGYYTFDSAAFDGARWRVSEDAVRLGWKPRQIGGNFEWNNFYSLHPGGGVKIPLRYCIVVTLLPNEPTRHDPRTLIAQRTYRVPFHRAQHFAALRSTDPTCRPAVRR